MSDREFGGNDDLSLPKGEEQGENLTKAALY